MRTVMLLAVVLVVGLGACAGPSARDDERSDLKALEEERRRECERDARMGLDTGPQCRKYLGDPQRQPTQTAPLGVDETLGSVTPR